MNKKIIIIIVALVVVAGVALAISFFVQRNAATVGSAVNSTSTGSTGIVPPVVTSTPTTATPTSTTITLGTSEGNVTVNNFYQNAQTITQDKQAVIIQNNADYAITYNVPDSSFSIAILSTPLEAARQEAESAFLSELGISQQVACKLTVYEGVPISVSDEYPGESFPLSFCGGPPTL
jgi:hypothetical protein